VIAPPPGGTLGGETENGLDTVIGTAVEPSQAMLIWRVSV
jgi:hypothetical protein